MITQLSENDIKRIFALNKNQISQLFDFVRSKYVRYIDVQHELVDHLASDIESEMNEDDTLSFEGALSKVYSKFPITGFTSYVRQSESAMNTMWYKLILSEFTQYGGIPFVLAFASLVYTIYLLLISFTSLAFYPLVIGLVIFSYISTWNLRSIVKGDAYNEDDKYLVVSIFKGWALSLSIIPLIASQYISDFKWIYKFTSTDTLEILLFSFLLSLSIIWSVLSFHRFPSLIISIINEKYSHLNLELKLD